MERNEESSARLHAERQEIGGDAEDGREYPANNCVDVKSNMHGLLGKFPSNNKLCPCSFTNIFHHQEDQNYEHQNAKLSSDHFPRAQR